MCAPSAVEHDPVEAARLFSFEELERGYRECRRRKPGTINALRFEEKLEENLLELAVDLQLGRYRPRRSVCFVTMEPKCREIIAADFRDRIVHHLVVRALERLWEPAFVLDSFASRKGKGTHAAVDRVEAFVRQVTANYTQAAWCAQLDIRSFFSSIDHAALLAMLTRRCRSETLNMCCERTIRRDIAADVVIGGPPEVFALVPPGKSLLRAPVGKGLPIGNHTSQFFANVYLNALDQFVKHTLRARYCVRSVDDMLLLSPSRDELVRWQMAITRFLRGKLELDLNPKSCAIVPLTAGIGFLGYIVHPRHRLVGRRVVGNCVSRLRAAELRLIENRGGYSWVLFRKGASERLRSTVASYRAHFVRADSLRLRTALRERFPWLERAVPRPGAKPFCESRGPSPCFAAQVCWLERKFPGAVRAVQVGTFWEFYGRDAERVAGAAGIKLYRCRWGGTWPWTRVPLDRLDLVLDACRRTAVREVVVIKEEGGVCGPILQRRATAVGDSCAPVAPGTRVAKGTERVS